MARTTTKPKPIAVEQDRVARHQQAVSLFQRMSLEELKDASDALRQIWKNKQEIANLRTNLMTGDVVTFEHRKHFITGVVAELRRQKALIRRLPKADAYWPYDGDVLVPRSWCKKAPGGSGR